MVDAAIGGKTGVNLPEGKNLVGAFWQPIGVLCDLDALDTLPPRERRCGRRRDGQVPLPHRRRPRRAGRSTERIARCVEIKAEVVAADEREGGRRALLNYGHTLAHALEIADRPRPAPRRGGRHRAGLRRRAGPRASGASTTPGSPSTARVVGGPTTCRPRCRPALDADELVALMGRDKKALDGLTFVLDGPAGVEVVRRRSTARRRRRRWPRLEGDAP